MTRYASSKHELNALKLEVKHCTEQMEKLRRDFSELKKETCAVPLIEKLRREVSELKKEVEATCKEVDLTRDTIYKVTELLSHK